MQSHSEIFESLFKRSFSSPDNTGFLQRMADKYPFFAPAQFYLLSQTKNDAVLHDTQAAKTAILFNNAFWLNYQLEQCLKADAARPQETVVAALVENEPLVFIPLNTLKDEVLPEPIPEVKETVTEDTTPVTFEPHITPTEETTIPTLRYAAQQNDKGPVFQPLFTTDYFASMGIKLSEEVLPTDKLGVQLKSFTEWLRTMKKVHADRLPQVDVQLDEKIQSQAERSNNSEDVVTEAMAEVLVHQGLKRKAIEVYEKLSLLSPAKSVYFAAKINQLKES